MTQLTTMVRMVDDSLGMIRNWVHEIEHLAGHADLNSTAELDEAYRKLGEARQLISKATYELENHADEPSFEVELV